MYLSSTEMATFNVPILYPYLQQLMKYIDCGGKGRVGEIKCCQNRGVKSNMGSGMKIYQQQWVGWRWFKFVER